MCFTSACTRVWLSSPCISGSSCSLSSGTSSHRLHTSRGGRYSMAVQVGLMTVAVPPCTFVGLCTRGMMGVVVLVFSTELPSQMNQQRITFKPQQIHVLNCVHVMWKCETLPERGWTKAWLENRRFGGKVFLRFVDRFILEYKIRLGRKFRPRKNIQYIVILSQSFSVSYNKTHKNGLPSPYKTPL